MRVLDCRQKGARIRGDKQGHFLVNRDSTRGAGVGKNVATISKNVMFNFSFLLLLYFSVWCIWCRPKARLKIGGNGPIRALTTSTP